MQTRNAVTRGAAAATLTLAAHAGLVSAQVAAPVDPATNAVTRSAPETYDGHALIQTWPATPRQRLAVSALSMTLMDEGVRINGGTSWLADASQRAALDASGVRYDVTFADVGPLVRAERTRLDAERGRWEAHRQVAGIAARIDDTFFDEFRPYADPVAPDLNGFLDQLVADHPDLIVRETIGASEAEGRAIEAFTITGPDGAAGKPALVFNGMAHAREWISPMTVLYMMDRLLDGYGSDAEITRILDTVAIHFIPISNPDGYIYSWDSERFWRKNRRNNNDGTFGVDWNRNFSVGHGLGSSFDTDSDTYNGGAPFTEAETRAIRDFVNARPAIVAHIDFHAFSQLILYPWGYQTIPVGGTDGLILAALAEQMSDTILSTNGAFYVPQQATDLYIAGGTSMDWTWGSAGAYSWTYELRPSSGGLGGFDPPPSEIRPTAEETLEGVLDLLGAAATGVIATTPRGLPDTIDADTPTTVGVTIIPAFSGPLDDTTATLWSRVGDSGPFNPSAMSALGDDAYEGDLPAAPCGETVAYYFSVDSTSGGTFTYPSNAPAGAFSADVIDVEVTVFDDAETDTGWTVGAPSDTATTGIWERANPEGTGAQPEDDHTPAGTDAWITDARAGSGLGTWDIDGGATTLTSPAYDAAPADRPDADATITYHRWYSNNQGASPNADAMEVLISNDDGQTWATLETVTENANAWVERSFRVADFVTPTSRVRLRFVASDLADGSIVEAGVDDVSLSFAGCDANPADLAPPFGQLTFADISAFLSFFNAGDPRADLAPPFGSLTFADISAFVAAFNDG